ncbi:hypothetical protein JVU11DRAFT_7033 [Chiua virens]|nr:hypothetical protein JVU11DRAFT_7033 [Chiua virens]
MKPSQVLNAYIASVHNIPVSCLCKQLIDITKCSTGQISNYGNSKVDIPYMCFASSDPEIHGTKEMDLQGLKDIPDFWDFDLDDKDEASHFHMADVLKYPGADEDTSKPQQP